MFICAYSGPRSIDSDCTLTPLSICSVFSGASIVERVGDDGERPRKRRAMPPDSRLAEAAACAEPAQAANAAGNPACGSLPDAGSPCSLVPPQQLPGSSADGSAAYTGSRSTWQALFGIAGGGGSSSGAQAAPPTAASVAAVGPAVQVAAPAAAGQQQHNFQRCEVPHIPQRFSW